MSFPEKAWGAENVLATLTLLNIAKVSFLDSPGKRLAHRGQLGLISQPRWKDAGVAK